jgi:hypothetical protein
MPSSSKPFTLRDLAVLAFIACLLVPVGARVIHNANNGGNRTTCATNLRQIGQAIMIYANAHKNGPFPRTLWETTAPDPVPTEYTGVTATDPFLMPGGPGPNDVTAGLYLLLRFGDVTSEVFVCPSSTTSGRFVPPPGSTYTSFSNFSSRAALSYAYTNPYPSEAARKLGFKLNYTLSSDFAISADMGPGPAAAQVPADADRRTMMTANSPNHRGQGQLVLYADGHVDWSDTPFCGSPRPAANAPRDNVYAYGVDADRKTPSAGIRGAPRDQYDTVILPSFDMGPQPGPMPAPDYRLLGGGVTKTVLHVSLVVLTLAFAAAVFVLRLRSRRAGRVSPPRV